MNLSHIVSHSYITVADLHVLLIIVIIITIVICFCTRTIVIVDKFAYATYVVHGIVYQNHTLHILNLI